jgi:hypothetical protein
VGFGKSKKTPVVSAYIEERGATMARVRLSFVLTKNAGNQFGASADEEPIIDPTVYQGAFEKINKEVFVRQAMSNPIPVATTAVGVASPAAAAIVPVAVSPTNSTPPQN